MNGILVCTMCNGTGWKVMCRQGDPVPVDNLAELRKCGITITTNHYAATTYESCSCQITKTEHTFQTIPIGGAKIIWCGGSNDHIVNCSFNDTIVK